MSDEDFPEGCQVILRSGGPVMTVEVGVRHDGIISVVWIVNGIVQRDGFHPVALVKVETR